MVFIISYCWIDRWFRPSIGWPLRWKPRWHSTHLLISSCILTTARLSWKFIKIICTARCWRISHHRPIIPSLIANWHILWAYRVLMIILIIITLSIILQNIFYFILKHANISLNDIHIWHEGVHCPIIYQDSHLRLLVDILKLRYISFDHDLLIQNLEFFGIKG